MASAFTHAFAALAGGKIFTDRKMPRRFWVLAALCAVIPDADAIGFAFGVPYGSFWGHRGFTHSLFFAFILALIVTVAFFREYGPIGRRRWWALALFYFAVTASHGLLDMLTTGGRGVAIFAPFVNTRYFFPWRPITVSPIGVTEFLGKWGMRVIVSEALWVWLPLGIITVAVVGVRRMWR